MTMTTHGRSSARAAVRHRQKASNAFMFSIQVIVAYRLVRSSASPAAQSRLASGQAIDPAQAPFSSQASDRDQEIKGVMP